MNGLGTPPVRVFYSYAHEDEEFREELERHLRVLERRGLIEAWHDRKIKAGEDWGRTIDHELDNADIIFFLISSYFLDSDYCNDIEVKRALARQKAGDVRVVPIIVRPCLWKAHDIGTLQAIPSDGRPITSFDDPHQAFFEIAQAINEILSDLRCPHHFGNKQTVSVVNEIHTSTRPRPGIHVGDISDAVERPDEMAWLKSQLLATGAHAHSTYVVIYGAPGVGKTFLAECFARQYFARNYINVFVGQKSPESAASDICHRLGIVRDATISTSDVIELMEAGVRDGLLILDNVENASIRELIPFGSIKTLLTTTNARVASDIAGANNINCIGEFSPNQSVALFKKYRKFGRQDEGALVELSQRVGNLPLAIAIAAQYLRYRDTESPGHLLDNIMNMEPLHETVSDLFGRTFVQLDSASQTLLVRLSFFAEGGVYSNVPMTIFRYANETFWHHVYDAKARSLLHIVRSSSRYLVKLHPLVRRFLQARDTFGTHRTAFLEALIRELMATAPEAIDYALIEQIQSLDAELMTARLDECINVILQANNVVKRTRFSVIESFDRLFSRCESALQGRRRYKELCVAAAEEAQRLNLFSKANRYLDLLGRGSLNSG